jgi:spore germination protein GerM
MPRHIKLGLIYFALVMVVGTAYYYNLREHISRQVSPAQESPQPYLGEKPVYPESAPMKKVTLFFPSRTKDGLLEPETREIHSSDQVSAEAKQIIAELIAGSKEGQGSALPPETKLREVFVSENGLAVVDLTKEVSVNHPGGLTQEISSIYAIVDSLTRSLPSVEKVQILIEGGEVETLAGHIDLSHPFSEDLSLTPLPLSSATGMSLEPQ